MPEPLTAPGPDVWPFRHVAFACDHPAGCDEDLDCGDIRADTFAQAMPAAVAFARAAGWQATDDGHIAYCPGHRTDVDVEASLLGVPGDEAPA